MFDDGHSEGLDGCVTCAEIKEHIVQHIRDNPQDSALMKQHLKGASLMGRSCKRKA